MAWEKRGDDFYYYQSEREGGRVRKKYIGRGQLAHIIAHADETRRTVKAQRRGRDAEAFADMEGLASAADGIHEAAEILARAELVAAGYHRHKGEWRRRRDA
jgi:hypothetical protein